MGRIVVNKHFDSKAQITPDKFVNKGELIISNQVGYEGIFIKNNNGEIFYIGPTEGTGADVPLEYKEYIASALTVYSTTDEMNSAIAQAISALSIPSLEGYATEEWVTNQGFATGRSVRQISAEEVAKIVNSADTKYDTLKEISDWILNDTTGAASMANDIQSLKAQLNALTLGAKASASISKSSIYVGEENSITVTGRMEPNTLTPCTVSIYKGSDLMASADTSVVSYTEILTGTTSYNIKAVYNGTTYTASTRVNAYYPTYYGFGVKYSDVLSNKNLLSSAKRTYTDTANADGVYYYILVPDGVSRPSLFTMGGAPFNMGRTNETINGVNYTVFKSGSVFNNGGSVNIVAA